MFILKQVSTYKAAEAATVRRFAVCSSCANRAFFVDDDQCQAAQSIGHDSPSLRQSVLEHVAGGDCENAFLGKNGAWKPFIALSRTQPGIKLFAVNHSGDTLE